MSSPAFNVEIMVVGIATGGLVVAVAAFGLYARAAWLALRGRQAVASESVIVAIAEAIVAAAAARVVRPAPAPAHAQACNEPGADGPARKAPCSCGTPMGAWASGSSWPKASTACRGMPCCARRWPVS